MLAISAEQGKRQRLNYHYDYSVDSNNGTVCRWTDAVKRHFDG